MEKSTKTALIIAATGLVVNKYQSSKINIDKPALTSSENNIKMTAGLVSVLGIASAGILEATKSNPKARKIAFMSLGGLTAAWFLTILYALKKMS